MRNESEAMYRISSYRVRTVKAAVVSREGEKKAEAKEKREKERRKYQNIIIYLSQTNLFSK